MLSKELEFTRKPDGGLADQIEVLEAMAEGDAYNTELLMLLIELRSLREQLAALKGEQVPVAVVELNDNLTVAEIRGDIPRRKAVRELYEGALVIGQELFTAAKPAEIPRHIYSMLVNELRDVPAIGCKRELIIGVLNRHGITAEPVQFDPPATE